MVTYVNSRRVNYYGLNRCADTGRIEVVGEADEIIIVRLDFSHMMAVDEHVAHVIVTGPAIVQDYGTDWCRIGFNSFPECPAEVHVSTQFSSGERMQDRFIARGLSRHCEGRIGSPEQTMGTV